MLSINIERIGANSRLILTMTMIIIHTHAHTHTQNNNRFENFSLRIGHVTIR